MPLQIDSIEPTSARLVATETFHSQAVRGSWLAQLEQNNLLPPTESPNAQSCYEAGRRLAFVHQIGKDFPLPLDNPWPLGKLESFLPHLEQGQLGSHSQHHTLEGQLKFLNDRPPYAIPTAMIHGDFSPRNQLNSHPSCQETMLFDLAITLNAWGFDDSGTFRASWFHAVLSGYESERSLRLDERRLFNFELRRAAVRNCILLLLDQTDSVTRAFEILHHHIQRVEMASYS